MKQKAMTYDRLKQIAGTIDENLTVERNIDGNIAIHNGAFNILISHKKYGELRLKVNCTSSNPKKLSHLASVIELASQYISSNSVFLTQKQKFLINMKPKHFSGGTVIEIRNKFYLEVLLQKGDTAPIYSFIDTWNGRVMAESKTVKQAIFEFWNKLHDPNLEGPDRMWSDINELVNEVYEES